MGFWSDGFHRLNGGLDALEVERGHLVGHDPTGNPSAEVAVKRDGDLSISSH